jgi:hypothetical protein
VLSLIQHLHGCGFREALRIAADIGGVMLDDGSERSSEQLEELRKQQAAYVEAMKNRPPQRVKPPPDPRQSATLWDRSEPVTKYEVIANYLACRAIEPARVEQLDLARVIPDNTPLPTWATYRGGPDKPARCWIETGHRLIVQTFDKSGSFVGLRAWRIGGDDDDPKRLPQSGYSAKGLVLANRLASDMLRDSFPGLLVVSEGEPDWMVHALRDRYAVVGITSGSWTQEIADRVSFGSEVVIRTDHDEAGENYANHIRKTLGNRVQVWRSQAA